MKFKLSAVLVSLLLLTSCSSSNNPNPSSPSSPSSEPVATAAPTPFKSVGNLKVHFIDVGQGDSILVQTPSGKAMLVDAGKKEDGQKIVDYIKSQGIQKLDALVYSYPAEEHLGGILQVTDAFAIDSVYMPRKMSDSPTQRAFLKLDKIKNTDKNEAAPGSKIFIDPDVTIDVVAPNDYSNENIKDYSAVLKLTYGENSFLLTGDATSVSEKLMLTRKYDLHSTVLKVADHGSKDSTSYEFFNAVAPKYAVISVGKGNTAGDPSKEVMDKLNTAAVQTYRTDESGTIVATTDGFTLKFDKGVAAKAAASPAAKTN